MSNRKVLVVVPCGAAKVWDREPERGSVPAQEAYTGAPFKVNREYAQAHADRWVILSAKYGLIPPDFLIPETYNVTFKRSSVEVVSLARLREQKRAQGLSEYVRIVGLGGRDYRTIIEQVFTEERDRLCFPFAGLPIGKAMQATKQAHPGVC
jgi:hypothetical protein